VTYLLSMWRPVWTRPDSHSGFRTELENLPGDAKGKGTRGTNLEAESTEAPVTRRDERMSRSAESGAAHAGRPSDSPTASQPNSRRPQLAQEAKRQNQWGQRAAYHKETYAMKERPGILDLIPGRRNR
jgi:hypothetical protein